MQIQVFCRVLGSKECGDPQGDPLCKWKLVTCFRKESCKVHTTYLAAQFLAGTRGVKEGAVLWPGQRSLRNNLSLVLDMFSLGWEKEDLITFKG